MTENHNFETPNEGATDWHIPLNENFAQLDTQVEVRDDEEQLNNYTPKNGAKFFATDTGRIFIGDGSQWNDIAVPSSGDGGGSGYENVKDYGAVGDGSTDDTAAIQQAIDAAGRYGGVFLPSGRYSISDTLHIGGSGQARCIVGTGGSTITVDSPVSGTAALTCPARADVNLHRFTINAKQNAEKGIEAGETSQNLGSAFFSHLRVINAASDAYHIRRPMAASFVQLNAGVSGGHGFNITGGNGTSATFESCYANDCGRDGWRIGDIHYSTFLSCASDKCRNGYVIESVTGDGYCENLSFISCGAEMYDNVGFKFTNVWGLTITSAHVFDPGSGPVVQFNGCDWVSVNGTRVRQDTSPALEINGGGRFAFIGSTFPSYGGNTPASNVGRFMSDIGTGGLNHFP